MRCCLSSASAQGCSDSLCMCTMTSHLKNCKDARRETGDPLNFDNFGGTEVRISVSGAKFEVESDSEVCLAVALQKPDQISEKLLKFLAENFSAESFFGQFCLAEILSTNFFFGGNFSPPSVCGVARFMSCPAPSVSAYLQEIVRPASALGAGRPLVPFW